METFRMGMLLVGILVFVFGISSFLRDCHNRNMAFELEKMKIECQKK